MIFSEEYDRSLWLMLAGDKENRDILLYFIKTIPKEIYDKIHHAISLNLSNEYINEFNYNNNFIKASDGFHYYIEIDFINGALKLKISRWKYFINTMDNNYHQEFEEDIELVVDKTYIQELELPQLLEDTEKKYIGTFSFKSSRSISSETNDIKTTNSITYNATYETITTPFGIFTKKVSNNKKKIRKLKKLQSYPEQIDELAYQEPIIDKIIDREQPKIHNQNNTKKLKLENKRFSIIKRNQQQE